MDPNERGEVIAHIPESLKYRSPGPAAYHISRKFKGKCPPIKMKGRHKLEQEPNKAPYYNIPSSLGKVPKITMHARIEDKQRFVPPGPSYVPPKFGSDACKVGIAPPRKPVDKTRIVKGDNGKMQPMKRRNPDETPGPGPGTFNIRDRTFEANGKTGTKIKGHHDFNYNTGYSPGPAAYKPRYEKVMPSAPKISFHIKAQPKETPINAAYRDIGSTLGGYKYTMKARATDDVNIL